MKRLEQTAILGRPASIALAALLALTAVLSSGCSPPAADPAIATQPAAAEIERPHDEPALPADQSKPAAAEETWDAYFMQGSRIGYVHTTIEQVNEAGEALVHTRNKAFTAMKRGGQTIEQEMTIASWDTPEGALVRFETRMTAGQSDTVTTGRVVGDKLQIEVMTLGKIETQSIPWKAEWGGLFAADQSLRKAPLQPGEKRTVMSLMPIVNLPGETQLVAGEYETVLLPSGERKLLRIESTIDLGGQKIDTTLWVDEKGQTLKTFVPAVQQETIRTTKDDALQPLNGGEFDLLVASTVPLTGKLPDPTQTRRVVYKAHVTSGKIDGLFANCLSQRVKTIDEQTATLTILAVRPNEPKAPDIKPAQPTDDDLAANNLIQCDDPKVLELSARIAPDETDPWKVACALEKHVDQTIKLKSFSQAFATAAEVARSLEGDCTEHAVLLAALCRARKIPARVAFGLVYYPPQKGFAYHMWNEVWITDRWVPLDATLGLAGIGGDHIKLADSNLAGASAYSAMLPVIQVFGRLKLEVVEAE
jgi:transglutaminase-like putative cysteine protease